MGIAAADAGRSYAPLLPSLDDWLLPWLAVLDAGMLTEFLCAFSMLLFKLPTAVPFCSLNLLAADRRLWTYLSRVIVDNR